MHVGVFFSNQRHNGEKDSIFVSSLTIIFVLLVTRFDTKVYILEYKQFEYLFSLLNVDLLCVASSVALIFSIALDDMEETISKTKTFFSSFHLHFECTLNDIWNVHITVNQVK